jgi:glucosamine-6-phosphate deaminase
LDTAHTEGWSISVGTDSVAISVRAAEIVREHVAANPQGVLSLPTGTTPLVLFDLLAVHCARGDIDFSEVEFYSLDDYLGLHPTDPTSLSGWLERAFVHRVNLRPDHVHLIPAADPSPREAAAAYDGELTRRGGFDLVVLGMGENGHIAFNEPGADASTRTRVVDLTSETREQAAAYWGNRFPVPTQAMTVGMANILEAESIVLMVSGVAKAPVLRRALVGEISAHIPASLLRLAGPRLRILSDEDAASELGL